MSSADEIQLIIFRVGGQEFAVDVFQVERILLYEMPSRLPKAPDFLEGVVSYRGGVVPVVDLRKRLEAPAAVGDETRTMILQLEGNRVGVVVDAVLSVKKLQADQVSAPPPIVQGLAAEFISGIVPLDGRNVVILAVAKLLSSKERLALDELIVETANE